MPPQPPQLTKRRVCLFGLSADPPTGVGGHVGIVQALRMLLKTNRNNSSDDAVFDEVRVLPVYRHTYADKRQRLVSFEHRFRMCEAAFATTGSSDALKAATGVTVSDAEYQSFVFACRNLPPDKHATVSVGTAALIEYLQSTEPAAEYTFVLGADAFVDLVSEKWKESARLLQLLQGRFIVLERPEENSDTNNEENARHLLQTQVRAVPGARLLRVDHLTAVSSSQVRECGDVHLLQTMVVPAVLDYMRQHGLYAAFENNNNIN